MPETFDYATANPGVGGVNFACDSFTQSGQTITVPATYLVYGFSNGPYTRVSAAVGLPISLYDGNNYAVGSHQNSDIIDANLRGLFTKSALYYQDSASTTNYYPVTNETGLPVYFPSVPSVYSQQLGTWYTRKANVTGTVASGSGNTVLKAQGGYLVQALVTTAGTGTGNVLIYDNGSTNSGKVVGVIPATVAIGTIYNFEMPTSNGITVANVASGPALTISYV